MKKMVSLLVIALFVASTSTGFAAAGKKNLKLLPKPSTGRFVKR